MAIILRQGPRYQLNTKKWLWPFSSFFNIFSRANNNNINIIIILLIIIIIVDDSQILKADERLIGGCMSPSAGSLNNVQDNKYFCRSVKYI